MNKRIVLLLTIVLMLSVSAFAGTKVSGSGNMSALDRVLGKSQGQNDYSEKPLAKKGSKGDTVKEIQEKLIELGFLDDKADGVFGSNTKQAVELFQEDRGLDITGEIYQIDYDALFAPEETATPEPVETPEPTNTPEPTDTPEPTATPTPKPTSFITDDGWCVSDDGIIEIKGISFDEDKYPVYSLSVQLRLDGSTLSDIISYSYDFSSEIAEVVSKNTVLQNRKVKVSLLDNIYSLEHDSGTVYYAYAMTETGSSIKTRIKATIDLATVFPDDFINYEAMNIAKCIKVYKSMLLNPSTMTVSDITVHKRKDKEEYKEYYLFNVIAQNRAGGMSSTDIVCCYYTNTGDFELANKDESKMIYSTRKSSDFMGYDAMLLLLDAESTWHAEHFVPFSSVEKYL